MTSGIVRRGDRLLRPVGPWSPAVHEYLRYLEGAGFDGSPRVLGLQDDREVLTFIEGAVAVDPQREPGHGHRLPPYARTDRALRGAGDLLRQLHAAASGFQPAFTRYRNHPRPARLGEIISHGDLGPWNTVYRDGIPVAFIDWDSAGPVSPLADLADAAWTFVPLAPPEQLAEAGSTHSLTWPPGCACSWRPTAWPTGRPSSQRWSAAGPGHQADRRMPLMPPRCNGSTANRRSSLARCKPVPADIVVPIDDGHQAPDVSQPSHRPARLGRTRASGPYDWWTLTCRRGFWLTGWTPRTDLRI
jgi:hypothetical protein